jgi:hypothetical protein
MPDIHTGQAVYLEKPELLLPTRMSIFTGIHRLVYELYGLTDEEIRIMEEGQSGSGCESESGNIRRMR